MKGPRFRISWLSVLLVAVLAFAQTSTDPDEVGVPIKVDVNVVNVLCTVRDGKGRLIPNLEKTDFELREDGKPQSILYFTRETKLPLTLGLLVDSSVSQGALIAEEREAAAAFFKQVLGDHDVAFLMSFDVNVDLLQDLTGSVDFLKRALGNIRVNGGGAGMSGPFPSSGSSGGTHLFDAVYLASTEVLHKETGRKAIILISDGQDQGSKISRQEAIRSAQKVDTIIYGILFVDRSFYGGRGGFPGFGYSGEGSLKDLAEETGGRVFNAKNQKELNDAFDRIATELRNQYSVGYTPTNSARDGSYRKLGVKVTKGSGLKVQARKGYYALPKDSDGVTR
ncbi:MAG: VWA domain-containing protein [Acidobacteria bacterium]|nr:VWA domain-containing protein [Acidobacteriota bacterium]